jgi:hypothetical protein
MCEIAMEGQGVSCGSSFDVLRAPDPKEAVAHVDAPFGLGVRWTSLPVIGRGQFARVEAHGEGIRMGGWASLDKQEFEERDQIDIVKDHVWIPAGAAVSIVGTSGAQIVISVKTPFIAPSVIEAAIDCDHLGRLKATVRVPAGPPYAVADEGRVDLRESPHGKIVFSFEAAAKSAWVWLGAKDGYVHIAGGQPPWDSALSGTPLLFDGWVEETRVRKSTDLGEDRDSGCDVPDTLDQCPNDVVVRDVPLYLGVTPGGDPVGTLERGTAIDLGERRSGFVAVSTRNRLITPLGGQLFWVHETDLGKGCLSTNDLDGCPPCP